MHEALVDACGAEVPSALVAAHTPELAERAQHTVASSRVTRHSVTVDALDALHHVHMLVDAWHHVIIGHNANDVGVHARLGDAERFGEEEVAWRREDNSGPAELRCRDLRKASTQRVAREHHLIVRVGLLHLLHSLLDGLQESVRVVFGEGHLDDVDGPSNDAHGKGVQQGRYLVRELHGSHARVHSQVCKGLFHARGSLHCHNDRSPVRAWPTQLRQPHNCQPWDCLKVRDLEDLDSLAEARLDELHEIGSFYLIAVPRQKAEVQDAEAGIEFTPVAVADRIGVHSGAAAQVAVVVEATCGIGPNNHIKLRAHGYFVIGAEDGH
mmetsp:Transcript_12316/g.28901  ORF Transcript_12316/g.28901 Transcript_12316/m.28901 type:complete len:325 (-) Transcript_12316:984-1958(-)